MDLERPGTKVIVSFGDVRGKRTEMELVSDAIEGVLSLSPGLSSAAIQKYTEGDDDAEK